jgi:hypothetical protein
MKKMRKKKEKKNRTPTKKKPNAEEEFPLDCSRFAHSLSLASSPLLKERQKKNTKTKKKNAPSERWLQRPSERPS